MVLNGVQGGLRLESGNYDGRSGGGSDGVGAGPVRDMEHRSCVQIDRVATITDLWGELQGVVENVVLAQHHAFGPPSGPARVV